MPRPISGNKVAWLQQIPFEFPGFSAKSKIPGKSTGTRPLTHTFSSPLPFITHSQTHSQFQKELLSVTYQIQNGDQDDAYEAWLNHHSFHLQTKTFVLKFFLHHHARRSSITLPKIPKINHRADQKTRHHCCGSDTVCCAHLTYSELQD